MAAQKPRASTSLARTTGVRSAAGAAAPSDRLGRLTPGASPPTDPSVVSAYDRLADVLRALEAEAVAYVLFGGQAVNAHGIIRFTGDIDLFVEPTPDNVARLRAALRRVWDDPEIDQIRAEDLAGEYAVVRYGTPDDFVIDITARIGQAFAYADVESQTLTVAGVPARVATPRMLYRMKKDTVRPHDHADAADLKRKFGLEDE